MAVWEEIERWHPTFVIRESGWERLKQIGLVDVKELSSSEVLMIQPTNPSKIESVLDTL